METQEDTARQRGQGPVLTAAERLNTGVPTAARVYCCGRIWAKNPSSCPLAPFGLPQLWEHGELFTESGRRFMGLWALTFTVPRPCFLNADWEAVSGDKHGQGGRLQSFLRPILASIQEKAVTDLPGNTPRLLKALFLVLGIYPGSR